MAREYKKTTEKQQTEIRRLNAEGQSDMKIALALGMKETTVRRNRLTMGLLNSKEVNKQLREQAETATRRPIASCAKSKKKPPEVKTTDDYCEGCIYRTVVHIFSSHNSACYYNVITGKKRPCKAGSGCTVKRVGKRSPTPVDIW